MELRRFLIIITVTLLIALILTMWFYPSNEDFRVENPFWNGSRDIKNSYPVHDVDSLADLPSLPNGTTLIMIPYLSCTHEELEQLNRFVSQGGRLILADDYGHGNQILEHMGLKERFTRQPLLDPLVNYKNKNFPKIIHFQPDPLTCNTDNLVFNHATSLGNVVAADILALSTSFSFLDSNSNGTWEDNEPTGPMPVISRHELGSGQVILVSDPSLFINSMEPIEDNGTLIENIAATTHSLYIDQSHLPPSELHNTKNRLQQARSLLATPPGTIGLVIAALIITLIPIWHKRKKTTHET